MALSLLPGPYRKLVQVAVCAFVLLFSLCAQAGVLSKKDIEKIFAPSMSVGEQNPGLPIWPLFERNGPNLELRGYAFESIDLEPVRGYSGKPLNLLVAISPEGRFLEARLIGHKEPLFMSAEGTAKLNDFAGQYKGLTVNHSIDIFGPKARTQRDESTAALHGVAAGTVSVKAIDRSIMESAMDVMRAQQELSSGGAGSKTQASSASAPRLAARHTVMDWSELLDKGLVGSARFTRQQIEQSFAGTPAQGNDKLAVQAPNELALEQYVALIGIPQIGRNLLDADGWRQLSANLRGASQAVLVTESGPLAKMAYESQRVQTPIPIVLRQGGRELTLRSMAYDKGLNVPGYPQDVRAYFLLIDRATPLDPTQAFDIGLRLGRRYGSFAAQVASADFPLAYRLPDAARWIASSYEPAWLGSWRNRAWELAVLVLGLAILAVALLRQKWLSAKQERLQIFRVAYLLFTVGFIGWFAQGQLTIVNITSALESLLAGRDLGFLMSDPMTVVLWAFVAITLLVWGRGTFCGWLCPFGALQELISLLVQRLGWKSRHLHTRLDSQLKWIKYGVLAVILAAVWWAPPFAEAAVEIEPFKTAISSYFQRDWPYVLWAAACLLLSVLVYRGYCRYICPLGAALAAVGILRRWNWIPRHVECGTPCQSCRHRCEYQAIKPSGEVDYKECFQCLDCVAIHQDDERCLPLIQERKKSQRVIPIAPVLSA